MKHGPRIALFANTEWYLFNFRLPLAKRLREEWGAEVWVICPDGPNRPSLESEGFHWIPVRMDRQGLNPIQDFFSAIRLARALARVRPHLLHNFTLKSILIGTLAARLAGVPKVVNAVTGLGAMFASGADSYRFPRGLLKAFFRWSFRSPSIRTVFQNQADLMELAPNPSSQARCRLIAGSGVDPVRFFPSATLPTPPRLILVSRLLRDKGILAFCEASVVVQEAHPGVEFLIAGSIDPGNPGSYTEAEVEALSARFPKVKFLGHQEDMPSLYRRSTLAVLPSRYREGVPRSLLEAACSGLPLVAFDGEGIRSIVQDGRTGRLVPPGDDAALAQALKDLLADPAGMERLGREGRALVLEQFSQDGVLDSTMRVYQELGVSGDFKHDGRMRVSL